MHRGSLRLRSDVGMQRGDHLRAFADCGRDPLDRARANIPDGIDSAAAALFGGTAFGFCRKPFRCFSHRRSHRARRTRRRS